MPKITNEEVEAKGEEELAHGRKASKWQSWYQSVVLWHSKALGILVTLWVSGLALLKSVHYGATKVLSLRGKSDHLILLPVIFQCS